MKLMIGSPDTDVLDSFERMKGKHPARTFAEKQRAIKVRVRKVK